MFDPETEAWLYERLKGRDTVGKTNTKTPLKAPKGGFTPRERDDKLVGPELEDGETTALDTVSAGITKAGAVDDVLAAIKAKKKLIGGTLPTIKFSEEGQSVLALFVGKTPGKNHKPEKPHFYATLDVIDPAQLPDNLDEPEKAVKLRAQLSCGFSLLPWVQAAIEGDMVKITYQGSTPNKNGFDNDAQHYTVEKVDLA